MAVKKKSKLSRFLKAPFRLLVRAKNLYVKNTTVYSHQFPSYGSVPTPPPTHPVNMIMPRSFSANAANSTQFDDDYRELLRAASTRSLRDKALSDHVIKVWNQESPTNNNMAKLQSVGIARIDEDAPLIDFGDDDVKVKHANVLPRSATYVAPPHKTIDLISF